MESSKKKILMITLRADFGGGPEHILRLVSDFCNEFDIYIACPIEYPYYDRYKNLIGETKLIEVPHRKFSLKYLFKLAHYIKINKIDLIHSHGKGAGIYSRPLGFLTKRKCIHTFHGLHLDNYNPFQKFIYLFIERFLSILSKRIISVSKSEFLRLQENKIAGKSKIAIIENGVKIPDSAIDGNNFYNHPKHLLSISRIDYAKNPQLLFGILKSLKEMNIISNFILDIIGINEKEFPKLISNDENNFFGHINFIGTVPDISKYLAKTFCYLSTSRWEGLPLGVMEAMAAGIPVVATNVPGNNDLIQHTQCGFLYDIQNPEEAAKHIKMISEDFELWKQISIAARERISSNYSIDIMADKTRKEYIGLLN